MAEPVCLRFDSWLVFCERDEMKYTVCRIAGASNPRGRHPMADWITGRSYYAFDNIPRTPGTWHAHIQQQINRHYRQVVTNADHR